MRNRRWLPMALCLVSLTACFHQVVQTGRASGSTVVDKPWVSTWLWGIVPAAELDVRRECPMGIAVVETETSFANGLVGVLTLGIYTPQHVRITCSSSSASLPNGAFEMRIPTDASAAQSAEITQRAVERAAETGTAVVLHF